MGGCGCIGEDGCWFKGRGSIWVGILDGCLMLVVFSLVLVYVCFLVCVLVIFFFKFSWCFFWLRCNLVFFWSCCCLIIFCWRCNFFCWIVCCLWRVVVFVCRVVFFVVVVNFGFCIWVKELLFDFWDDVCDVCDCVCVFELILLIEFFGCILFL